MRLSFALLAIAAGALANPVPQGVTSDIAPTAAAPAGCSPTYPGTFEITVVNATSSKKRDLVQRQASGVLTLSLAGGVLHDQAGRTGYIASNFQFQFDSPPQTGAIYTGGFSVCANNSLALGGSAVFYQCNSGGFFNLYDRSWAAQCSPIYLVAEGATPATVKSEGQPGATSIAPATEKSEGQPGATSIAPVTEKSEGQPVATSVAPVTEKSEGQPVATGAIPVSQISDGQPQGPTGVLVTQITDGQPQAPTGSPVSQLTDGQPQVPTGAPVSQITDGQPQAPTGAPVSQITDGQPQAPTGAPVSQITDGQPQAPTGAPVTEKSEGQPVATPASSTGALVTEKSEGQPIATTAVPVSQITDGQIQAPTGNGTATYTAAPSQFTGAAASPVYGLGAMAAGVIGVVAML